MKRSQNKKKTRFAIIGAVVGGLGAGLINVISQSRSRQKGEPFDWAELAGCVAGGALIVGAGGWSICALLDHKNVLEKPLNTSKALLAIASAVALDKTKPSFIALDQKAEWLIEKIAAEFPFELKTRPYKYGSTESNTALKATADIDIAVECKPGSFSSTEQMYFMIGEYLDSLVGSGGIDRVRDQRVSFGVYFHVAGKDRKIDVTPHKLSPGNGSSTAGYLYVNRTGLFQVPGRTKTDIQRLKSVPLTKTQTQLVLLLKQFRLVYDLPLSSPLLQQFVLYTYTAYSGLIPRDFTKKLLLVLRYIADNIEGVIVQSPVNTNNILTDQLDSWQKAEIRKACLRIIEAYEYQPNSIMEFFK
jgi:hypothetical protein